MFYGLNGYARIIDHHALVKDLKFDIFVLLRLNLLSLSACSALC